MQDNIFGKGNIYQIICKNSETALRIDCVQSPLGSKISACNIDSQDITQLWLIDKVNNGKDYELCNALSCYCLDDDYGIVYLKKGKWANSQLFKIEKAPFEGFYQYFWIRLSKHQHRAISFEGVLRCVDFNQNDDKQMFRFQPVLDNVVIDRTVMIMSQKSGRVLDVPHASDNEKEIITQYEMNKRFNQRWLLIKSGSDNTYQIQNFKSGLNLDIVGESIKPGTKVIQYKPTSAANQLWILEKKEDNTYLIRSVLCSSLFLSVQGNSNNDGAKIVVNHTETRWKLEGESM